MKKAFDNVNHRILMKKLLDSGVPKICVKVIEYWYENQMVNVKYKSNFSTQWRIRNSPFWIILFIIYRFFD